MASTRTKSAPTQRATDSLSLESDLLKEPESIFQDNLDGKEAKSDGSISVLTDVPSTRVGRLGKQFSELSDDLKEIAELRIALAKAEMSEQIDFRLGKVKQGSVTGTIVLLGAFFLLVTIGLGLGWLFGHMFWGFLIITLGIFLVGGLTWLVLRPKPPTT